MNSSPYPHDDHLRHLLDQRSARADINGRFSSVSEYSDTPSVYSHRFSPVPQDRGEGDFSVRPLNVDASHRYPFSSEPRSPMSDRDLLNDPSASGLDLDDDYRSSYASSNTYDDSNEQPLSPTDVGEDSRMSMLGPKVRIHGRAPWEMGEESLEEGDESDSSGKSYAFSIKRAKGKGDGIMKGFGRGAPSPRPTLASRPSDESNRSRSRSKGSFETTASSTSNSQGGLHPSAQASVSSTSLTLPSSEPSGKGSGLRNKFSRVRSRIDSRAKSPTTSEFSRASSASSPRPSISAHVDPDFVHPYANPDLVVSYASDPTPNSPNHGAFGSMSRSDSISTITDVHSVSSHSTLRHMASGTSLRQASLPTPRANLTGKGISSPINTLRSSDLSPNNPPKIKEPQVMARPPPLGPNGIPGWMDNPGSPTIQLISLEEAQAQARERARSATINSSMSNQATFPEPIEKTQSPTNSMRSRTRSISAGAKARSALSNIVGGSPPAGPDRRESEPTIGVSGAPGKSLKHKKSGFMRIFNGKERDAVPPVPILADEYTVHNNSQPPSIPKAPKISLSRVPVPPLGSSTVQESPSSSSFLSDVSNSSISVSERNTNVSPKRAPPALQIHTPSLPSRTLATGNLTLPTPTLADKSDQDGEALRSAPPSTSDFPSLSLRPVSTIFSAHFADHIVAPEGKSPVEERIADTPSSISPATGRSPMTPGFPLRSDGSTGDKCSIAVVGTEDQSSVIQALQEQIVSARKAWQRHIWELEGQVRDLKAEVDDLRTAGNEKGHCEACGRAMLLEDGHTITKKVGVVNRPRARTGDVARFANGN